MPNYLVQILLSLSLLGAGTSSLAETQKPWMSNYAYELTSGSGRLVYLFGSSHYSVSSVPTYLGPCVKNLIKSSRSIFLEVDQLAVRSITAPKSVSMQLVAEHLDQDTLEALDSVVFGRVAQADSRQWMGMDAAILLNVLISRIPGGTQLLGQMDFGLDTELSMAARFLDIPVAFVESPENQLHFHEMVPAKYLAQAIEAALKLTKDKQGAERHYRSTLSMLQAGASGDEERLLQYFEAAGFSGYYQSTIFARNESLTDKVEAVISGAAIPPIFIALGAAHLAGKDSVVRRLESRGFKTKRLCL